MKSGSAGLATTIHIFRRGKRKKDDLATKESAENFLDQESTCELRISQHKEEGNFDILVAAVKQL
jgi:hypothetical protein